MDDAEQAAAYLASMSEGKPIACTVLPVLTPKHLARLRGIWSLGRPMHLRDLEGIDLDLIVHGLAEAVHTKYSVNATLAMTRLGAGRIGKGAEDLPMGHSTLTVTERGIACLSDARQAAIAAQRPHHELGQRLSQHLNEKGLLTWQNLEFVVPGPLEAGAMRIVRPDVFACKKAMTAAGAAPTVYEVKVSRADFLRDRAKPPKRAAYAALSEAVFYCAPQGMISPSEVPDDCGLLVEVAPGDFELAKRAPKKKGFVLHADTAMTLMLKRVPLDVHEA